MDWEICNKEGFVKETRQDKELLDSLKKISKRKLNDILSTLKGGVSMMTFLI